MMYGAIGGVQGVTAVALTQLVGRGQSRVLLQITCDSGVMFVTDNPGAAAQTGYPVTPQAPLILRVEEHGDLVTHDFYGSSGSLSINAGTIEVFASGAAEGNRVGVS